MKVSLLKRSGKQKVINRIELEQGSWAHQDGPAGEERVGSEVEVSPDVDAQVGGRKARDEVVTL